VRSRYRKRMSRSSTGAALLLVVQLGSELRRGPLPLVPQWRIVRHPKWNLLVHGSYQSGTALLDFTDHAHPGEVAWKDPDPLDPPTATSPGGRTSFRARDWSSYWYDGVLYESDTSSGLFVCNVSASGFEHRT
jgi:hypothetical protein